MTVSSFFFEQRVKAGDKSFDDFEPVPEAPAYVPTEEEIQALKDKMSAEGFKKNSLTKADKAVLAYIEANGL